MATKKVWIASRIEFVDGEFELVDQKVCATKKDAADWCGVDKSGICKCAKGKQKTAGKDPKTKEPLKWVYLNN